MDHPSRDAGTVSGLLAESMSKLSVEMSLQRKQDVKTEKINPFLLTWESCVCPEASSSQTKTHHPAEDGAPYNVKVRVFTGLKSCFWFLLCSLKMPASASCLCFFLTIRCLWLTVCLQLVTSFTSPVDNWCQKLHYSLTCVSSARLFFLATQPLEESSYDISTLTSHKLHVFFSSCRVTSCSNDASTWLAFWLWINCRRRHNVHVKNEKGRGDTFERFLLLTLCI